MRRFAVGPAFQLLLGLRVEDGRRWGERAQPFQLRDAAHVLASDTSKFTFLTRPRGGSKSLDISGMLTAWLATEAAPQAQADVVAVDRQQAAIVHESAQGFVARNRELHDLLRVSRHQITNTQNGATLTVQSGDGASMFGRRPAFFVADEFAQWPSTPKYQELWEAGFSGAAKVPGARVVIATTAGHPGHPSHKLIVRARSSDSWNVLETPGPCPWIEPAALAEQKAVLLPATYARLHLNQWASGAEQLLTYDDVTACMSGRVPMPAFDGAQYVGAVDLGLVHDRTVITVGHHDDGRVVIDDLLVVQGTREEPVSLDEVGDLILDCEGRYPRTHWKIDPWNAASLVQRLRRERLAVTEFPFNLGSNNRVASALVRAVRERRLVLPHDEELVDELLTLRVVETSRPGVFKLDHKGGSFNDQAIALGMLCDALLDGPRVASIHAPLLGALP